MLPSLLPRRRRVRAGKVAAATSMLVAGWLLAPAAAVANPVLPYENPDLPVAERVDDLLGRMSLDQKLGQMVQAERAAAGPADVANYHLGSVLSGGGSTPTPNTPEAWADMYDAYQRAATSTELGIPILYGVDAVHGHNNVYGATIFPHNIGLGAMHDPELVRKIGRATAEEVSATGIDWNFAPCLCVARDIRWGRTYESFGELPQDAVANASLITGLQGETLGARSGSVLATAKHYIGDGGTTGGNDRGNTQISEQRLRKIHLPPFKEAIERGVGAVMISYSKWNGDELHGHRYLITEVLKQELGFDGIVISDYNGINDIDGQEGLGAGDVRGAVNAGIDMFMVPNEYAKFIDLLRAEVVADRVSMERIDDAVSRILTKKFQLGLFEHPYTDRKYLKDFGSKQHQKLARQAVRESQVLLKNNGVLPLDKNNSKIFVAGSNADDIGNQSGGWTISWQGSSGPITPGTTILEGIKEVANPNSTVTYDQQGDGINSSYDVAVAVVGEKPYAEFQGDRPEELSLSQEDLDTIAKLRATGVPVVVVLVSGRPMVVTEQLPHWDALLASWLPGTEGGGVADVLFGKYDPTGALTFSWPRTFEQIPINAGDGKDALFGYGYGLSYDNEDEGVDEEDGDDDEDEDDDEEEDDDEDDEDDEDD